MTPEKGVDRAIAIARAAGVQLRIAAKMREPHEHQYFDEFVRPYLGDDVLYLGVLGVDDKRALLAGAAALLNPIAIMLLIRGRPRRFELRLRRQLR